MSSPSTAFRRVDRQPGGMVLFMHVAVLADLHGNLPAIDAVLASSAFQECEAVLIAGDIVGYYPWALESLQFCQEHGSWVVRGNHDDMLLRVRFDAKALEGYREAYGFGLDQALASFEEADYEYLGRLPSVTR